MLRRTNRDRGEGPTFLNLGNWLQARVSRSIAHFYRIWRVEFDTADRVQCLPIDAKHGERCFSHCFGWSGEEFTCKVLKAILPWGRPANLAKVKMYLFGDTADDNSTWLNEGRGWGRDDFHRTSITEYFSHQYRVHWPRHNWCRRVHPLDICSRRVELHSQPLNLKTRRLRCERMTTTAAIFCLFLLISVTFIRKFSK